MVFIFCATILSSISNHRRPVIMYTAIRFYCYTGTMVDTTRSQNKRATRNTRRRDSGVRNALVRAQTCFKVSKHFSHDGHHFRQIPSEHL